MFFLCTVETESDGDYRYVASTGSTFHAARLARKYALDDGLEVVDVTAELFNTFEHGDTSSYTLLE